MHCITVKSNTGLLRQLFSTVEITLPGDVNKSVTVQALWDTGATSTVITQKVVDALGSILVTKGTANTASEANVVTDIHLIDLYLSNRSVGITGMNVTVGKLTGFDCLIGMDVITLGDFSITNHKGATCMSYRIPSSHELDYVKLYNDSQSLKQANANYLKKLKGSRKGR